jgi:hypothetical protein
MRKRIWIVWMVAGLSFLAVADEGQHHEALTQEQLGTVHFPVSCTAEAQKNFEKGVALLHSFWYEEAAGCPTQARFWLEWVLRCAEPEDATDAAERHQHKL